MAPYNNHRSCVWCNVQVPPTTGSAYAVQQKPPTQGAAYVFQQKPSTQRGAYACQQKQRTLGAANGKGKGRQQQRQRRPPAQDTTPTLPPTSAGNHFYMTYAQAAGAASSYTTDAARAPSRPEEVHDGSTTPLSEAAAKEIKCLIKDKLEVQALIKACTDLGPDYADNLSFQKERHDMLCREITNLKSPTSQFKCPTRTRDNNLAKSQKLKLAYAAAESTFYELSQEPTARSDEINKLQFCLDEIKDKLSFLGPISRLRDHRWCPQ